MTTSLNINDIGFVNTDDYKLKLGDILPNGLINKIKNVVYLNKMSYDNIYFILKKELINYKKKYKQKDINISYNKEIIDSLVKETEYKYYGARRIEDVLEKYIDKCIYTSFNNKKIYS